MMERDELPIYQDFARKIWVAPGPTDREISKCLQHAAAMLTGIHFYLMQNIKEMMRQCFTDFLAELF